MPTYSQRYLDIDNHLVRNSPSRAEAAATEDDEEPLGTPHTGIINLTSHTISITIPKLKQRSNSFSLPMLGSIQIGIPSSGHRMLDSSPTTPTQAVSAISPPTSPTSIKPRARALTITSIPRSPQPPVLQHSNTISSPKSHRQRQDSTSSQTPTITSPRNSPPPDFLLDDDPFANLTGNSAPVGLGSRQSSLNGGGDGKILPPRSPLIVDEGRGVVAGSMKSPTTTVSPPLPSPTVNSPRATTITSQSTPTSPAQSTFYGNGGFEMRSSFPSIASSSSSSSFSSRHSSTSSSSGLERSNHSLSSIPRILSQPSPAIPRPPSFTLQPHRPSPAHQRPAFKSRPSLPSLNTLAQMTFVPGAGLGVRKRKGKVGAGLPFEPWNNLDNLESGRSSGESSPVVIGPEASTSGDEVGGGSVPPVPPLPPLVSVSRSMSDSVSSRNESNNLDTRIPLSPPSPAIRRSTSVASSSSSSSSTPSSAYSSSSSPPSVSLAPTSSALTCQPIPPGQRPLLPSQILALGSEVGVVYGSGMMLRSPPRSPPMSFTPPPPLPLVSLPLVSSPPPPPPQLIPRSSVLASPPPPPSADIGLAVDIDSASGGSTSPRETAETVMKDLDDDPILTHRQDVNDDVGTKVRVYDDDDDDDSDVDVDRFMDQFMDHYDREESGSRLGLYKQEQEQEEQEDDVLVGKISRRSIIDEDEIRPRSPTPPPLVTAAANSLIETVYAIPSVGHHHDMTTTTFPIFNPDSICLDTSTAILAPTLRTRTRTKRMAAITTTNADNSEEVEGTSFLDSYLYTRPSLRNEEVDMELETSPPTTAPVTSSSGLTPPPPPPASARDSRWSPSESESVSVSRSRSLSSTYTSLSFGSESESSSGPQSSFGGDDDKSGGISRFQNTTQPPLPLPLPPTLPPLLSSTVQPRKSAAEEGYTIDLDMDEEAFGFPLTSLSMPFTGGGGNEDMGYFVPFSGSIGPLSDLDNTGIRAAAYYDDGDDDSVKLNTGEEEEAITEPFNPHSGSRHSAVSKLSVVIERKKNSGVDDLTRERGDGIEHEVMMREKVKKTEMETVQVGHEDPEEEEEGGEEEGEVEWEYVVGGGRGEPFGEENGSSHAFIVEQQGELIEKAKRKPTTATAKETETDITIATPDKSSEPIDDVDADGVVNLRHSSVITSPITTTTTTTTTSMTRQFKDKDGLGYGSSSSSAAAAAFAMSTWERDGEELVVGEEEGFGGVSSRGGIAYHATHQVVPSSPFEWKGRRGGGNDDDDDGDDDEKRRSTRRAAPLERGGGRRDHQTSFLAISSDSSSSSEDDYGLASSSPSQLVMNTNLRIGTYSSDAATPSPGYLSASSARFPVSRGSSAGGGRFSGDDDEEDEDEDEDEVDDDDDDDDDIPLAKRIPSALTAQKSIRHQVRQEREQKKREKALCGHQNETARTRLMTLRPSAGGSNSQDAPSVVASSQHIEQQYSTRQRTQTLTGKGGGGGSISVGNPFSAEDLARKLRDIDGGGSGGVEAAPIGAAALYQQQQARLDSRNRSKSVSRSSWDSHPPPETFLPPIPHIGSAITQAQRTKSMKEPSSSRYPSPSPINSPRIPFSTLRPMRSFHRSNNDRRPIGMDDSSRFVTPSSSEQRVSRSSTSITRSRPSTRDGLTTTTSTLSSASTTPHHHHHHHHHRSLSQSRSSVDRASPMTIQEPVPPIPTARISHDEHRKLSKLHHYESRVGSTRTSVDAGGQHPRTSSHQHRPVPPPPPPPTSSVPVDPLPTMTTSSSKPSTAVVQQRVFVGDMQRFKMVEISTSTTAGDIIEMIEAEGSLMGLVGNGGWMVFEVAQDFGMERPIRSFELVSDVQASWNKDKMVNYLVLRLTPLAVPLNRSAIPSSSPTHSGYVEWESKRGKWSKRWMALREHSIWLSKRDNGRDEVLLCSLSNFDAYQVTRSHRSPKPFAFAVKSTDKLSFFENTADYLHSFACSEKDGKVWMEKILVARSYVLFQERHVLFNPKSVNNNFSGVSRSGTRKTTTTTQRPAVSLSHHDVFEPNSLLSKQP